MLFYIAVVLAVSFQFVPSHTNDTVKTFPGAVPVLSVPVVLKFVPQVSVKAEVPAVVITNTQRCPAVPPEALNLHEPVGVIVMTVMFVSTVVMVPVVAGAAALPPSPVDVTVVHVPGVPPDEHLYNKIWLSVPL